MKKRINSTSSLKGERGALDPEGKAKQPRKAETPHLCPIPKIPKKEFPSKKNQQQGQKQISGGINLEELIYNLINSADRIASHLREEERSCPYALYLQDRNKLVEFLDSASVSVRHCQAHVEQLKKQRGSLREDYLSKQLNSIQLDITKAIRRKKRSKSTSPNLPNDSPHQKGEEAATVRYLLAQQSNKNSALKLQVCQLERQIEHLKGNFVYLELLAFKTQQMFIENLIDSNDSSQFSRIQKKEAAAVLQSLRQIILQLRSQEGLSPASVTSKLKEEAQALVLFISEMRRKAAGVLKEKERSLARLAQEEENFAELKGKVDRLNNEMGELTEEVDRKDELIEYVKLENGNLKEDLRSMEELVRQTKQQYNSVADELYLTSEKGKVFESLLQGREEQINELLSEVDSKNNELIAKLEEIQAKEEDISALKQELVRLEEVSARAISTLSEEKKLLALEKQRKENELKQTESKVKFLEEEGSILERKIETVFNEEEDYKFKISLLEDKVEALERENQQLSSDLQRTEKEEADQLLRANKRLQSECASLKREASENMKRIKFYEQQMLQLAKMTDTSYYEKIIEEQQKTIYNLQLTLRKDAITPITPIPEENSEEIQAQNSPIHSIDALLSARDNPEGWSRGESKGEEILQDLIDCIPSFEERGETQSDKSGMVIDQLNVSKDVSRDEHSALSYYQIHVINENSNKIDSHKAVSPKKVSQQHLELIPVRAPRTAREPSNFADCEASQMGDRRSQKSKSLSYSGEDDEREEQLSQISRNVNVDRQADGTERMNDLEEEVTPVKPPQIQDLLMSEVGAAEIKRKGLSPMKNVDVQQEMKAELRFEGEIEKETRKSRLVEEKNEKHRANLLLNNIGKIIRARSCMGKDD